MDNYNGINNMSYKDKCVDIKQYASTLINKLKDVDINNVGAAYENMLSMDAIEKLKELADLINDKVNAFYGEDDEAHKYEEFPYLVETGSHVTWLQTNTSIAIWRSSGNIIVDPGTVLTVVTKKCVDGVTWLGVKYPDTSDNSQLYWVDEEDVLYSPQNYIPDPPIATSSNIDWDIISKMSSDTNVSKSLDIKRAFNISKIPIFDTPLEGHALIDLIEPENETGTVLLSHHMFFNDSLIPSKAGLDYIVRNQDGADFRAIKYGPKKYGYVKSDYINYDVWEKQ